MNSPVEEIKSRIDITELIQSYIRLEKAGINFKAVCPFHAEKTPSFFVSPSRQIWHCFGGCGEGGDIFKFVMKIEGLDFPEALKLLAQRAGVVLRREDPSLRSDKNRLYDLCEEAAAVFERNLERTPAARSYLARRGVKEDTLKNFRIGFAPQSWDFLLKALAEKGFRREDVEKAGLAIRSEDKGSHYDRFRGRIMFPIADANGRVAGFSGRVFEEESRIKNPRTELSFDAGKLSSVRGEPESGRQEAKYVNTPNTLIYDKSRILYGFDKAKQEIRTKNLAVLVEGQMDCVMSHQAGVRNTVAVSGTALTPQHLTSLKRLCGTLVTSFDTDAAGDSATRRSLELAAQFGFRRKIAAIPSGKDPAEAVLDDPALWQRAVEESKEIVEFYFERALTRHDPATADGKKSISSLLLPYIAELPNEIEKAHWASKLAEALKIAEEAVWRALRGMKSKTSGALVGSDPTNTLRRDLLEERILSLLALSAAAAQTQALEGRHLTFASPLHQQVFAALTSSGGEGARASNLSQTIETLRFKGEVLVEITKEPELELSLCARELEKECLKERLNQMSGEIRRLEREGNQEAVSALLQDFRSVSEKLKLL